MIGNLFTAVLDEGLDARQRDKVLDDVKKLKGVFSADFAKAAKPKAVIAVHAWSNEIQDDVRKIPGVKTTKSDPRMRM
jgi:hypothetical protein